MATEEHIDVGDGSYVTGAADVPGVPVFAGNDSGTIYFTIGENDNGTGVTYAIYIEEEGVGKGYIKADGTDNGASEVWQTMAAWGSVIGAKSLTQTIYRVKAKAKNEADVETAFSSYSGYMAPYRELESGGDSNTLNYECTTGQCKVSGVTITGTSKVVTIAYTLTKINTPATKNNVKIHFSTDGVTYTDITTAGAIGGDVTSLTASVAGTANSNTWSTCLTVGNSYRGTVYIKIVPYDTATAGNAGDGLATSASIDNRPSSVTIAEYDGFAWDDDTTPEIIADMADIVCGDYLFFICEITNATTGALIQSNCSAYTTAGWQYEQDHAGHPETWTTPTLAGIPAAYVPPTLTGNRVMYTVQTALTQGVTYNIKLIQCELKSVLV
jgi:hypothetical protein